MTRYSPIVTHHQSHPCGFSTISGIADWWGSHSIVWCGGEGAAGRVCRQLEQRVWTAVGLCTANPARPIRMKRQYWQLFLPSVILLQHCSQSTYSPAQHPNCSQPHTYGERRCPVGFQQALLCRSLPTQGFPPRCGAGLLHCRLRRAVPDWQGPHSDQQLHCPFVSPPVNTWGKKKSGWGAGKYSYGLRAAAHCDAVLLLVWPVFPITLLKW